ncbi:MAG: hypothetical protein HYU53_02840 [Acidobacteria bacterium]|nr:hypothetical protein [Acidobacteriota bacterium]
MTPRAVRMYVALFAVSVLGTALALVQDPQRGWAGILLASYALAAVGLGGLLFVAIQYASGADWGVAFRRVPEAMTAALPFGAAGVALVMALHPSLYAWTGEGQHFTGFKALWLSTPFFFWRAAVYVALWLLFTRVIVGASRAQDRGAPAAAEQWTRTGTRWSVLFIVVFALTFWLASFDWIMSLDAHWYSTIFGIYNFAGLFSAALAVIILLLLWLRGSSELGAFVTDEHVHDLGKLLFAFCTFWMYIWFSQYMLMWYANIPEEAGYFVRRRTDGWLPLFYLNVVLNWVVPFLALLSRPAKRNARVLASVAVVVLAGRWLDLYMMIQPSVTAGPPVLRAGDVAPVVGAVTLFVLVFARAFRQAPPVPLRDPRLAASITYHS